jgi:allantoicase
MQPSAWVQGEVLLPGMAPRMKQGHEETRRRVDGRDVRALVQITANATEAEILNIVCPLALSSDPMM